mgnify:CR=1 FL=1
MLLREIEMILMFAQLMTARKLQTWRQRLKVFVVKPYEKQVIHSADRCWPGCSISQQISTFEDGSIARFYLAVT